VRTWVADNVVRWKEEAQSWFKIEMIPVDLLPRAIFEAEGGERRKRSIVGIHRINVLPERRLD